MTIVMSLKVQNMIVSAATNYLPKLKKKVNKETKVYKSVTISSALRIKYR